MGLQIYSKHVGVKFMTNGAARCFPGNTVICFIDSNSKTFQLLKQIHLLLEAQPWAKKFSLLPPSSYHMTVFEGVCDQVRDVEHWTQSLPLDAKLNEVDEFLKLQWQQVVVPTDFSMQFDALVIGNFITIRLKPVDAAADAKIRGFRDLLSERFQIRNPGHDSYGFHVSLAYNISPLDEGALQDARNWIDSELMPLLNTHKMVSLVPPRLVYFEDMTHFADQRELTRRNVQF